MNVLLGYDNRTSVIDIPGQNVRKSYAFYKPFQVSGSGTNPVCHSDLPYECWTPPFSCPFFFMKGTTCLQLSNLTSCFLTCRIKGIWQYSFILQSINISFLPLHITGKRKKNEQVTPQSAWKAFHQNILVQSLQIQPSTCCRTELTQAFCHKNSFSFYL